MNFRFMSTSTLFLSGWALSPLGFSPVCCSVLDPARLSWTHSWRGYRLYNLPGSPGCVDFGCNHWVFITL